MKLTIKELAVFAMLGALMYASKVAMQFLPNIHLIGVMTVAMTVVFRRRALYPLYVYIFLEGLFGGFTVWWIPYLYIWAILWGVVMLLPESIPYRYRRIVYMIVCSAHGFLFGTLYAPAQALLTGMDFDGMIAWIIAGLPFDFIHGVSNFFCGILIAPIVKVLKRFENESIK